MSQNDQLILNILHAIQEVCVINLSVNKNENFVRCAKPPNFVHK